MTVRKLPYHINLGEIASKRKRKKLFLKGTVSPVTAHFDFKMEHRQRKEYS